MKKWSFYAIYNTWRFFFYSNIKNIQYFIFGYKKNIFLTKKYQNQGSIQNKLDLVDWFIKIQDNSSLQELVSSDSTQKYTTNFELFLGRADLDTVRTVGYIDTRFLDEMQISSRMHKLEKNELIRNLIFFYYLKKQGSVDEFKHYNPEILDLVVNFEKLQHLNNSHKIYFLLNTKHLSNYILHMDWLNNNNEQKYYFYNKQIKDYYQQLSEYITLFDFKETESNLTLSGTVDRLLQESAWRGRYRIAPTLVKNLDSSEEFISRLGFNSYKSNINHFDYQWWQFHSTLSQGLLQSTQQISPFNLTVLPNINYTLTPTFQNNTILEHGDYILTNYITNLREGCFFQINQIHWNDFLVLYASMFKIIIACKNINYFTQQIYFNHLGHKEKIYALNSLLQLSNQLSIKFDQTLKNYTLPEFNMLKQLQKKFQEIFFLRASIGANWGFLDVDLLSEEQEAREKDQYYQKYDDNARFFYFLSSKDLLDYDDTTYLMDVKYKKFIDDVYNPHLVSPHKRPYNWLQIPEMSFSPFFFFLKHGKNFWYKIFNFNFSTNTKHIDSIIFNSLFSTRFLNLKDLNYVYKIKHIFSINFLQNMLLSKDLESLFFSLNMQAVLMQAADYKVNEKNPQIVKLNTLLKTLTDNVFLPEHFKEYYKIQTISDIYSYNAFFINNKVLETTLKIEQRKANQLRFNLMYKQGLSPEHSWFFLYHSPALFKQTVAYQAWIKKRVPNIYAWEHDNPFLIQQIFRPYSLDLTKDSTLYKYKADMLQLLLFGFKETVFAETFLVKNYYTKNHKNRSIFEMPQYTIPFFLFDSDLSVVTKIPETVPYEHISSFGIPALERQWSFDEITIDLTQTKQTSVWPNYLFKSEAYAMLLWTPGSTKNIFGYQEYDSIKKFNERNNSYIFNKNKRINQTINKLSRLSSEDFFKIYSYFFKKILTSKNDCTANILVFLNARQSVDIDVNTILFLNISFLNVQYNFLNIFQKKMLIGFKDDFFENKKNIYIFFIFCSFLLEQEIKNKKNN